MRSQEEPESSHPLLFSGTLLLFANAVPLAGVLVWGWSVLEIVAVYWAENLVVGVFTLLRIFTVRTEDADSGLYLVKAALSVFFFFHYGIFCLVHGIFVFSLLGSDRGITEPWHALNLFAGPLRWAILALVASHGISFLWHYLAGGENRRTTLNAQMGAPYPRIVVLHIAILLGAFAIQAVGQPIVLLSILVVGKTALDLQLHRLAHRRKPESEGEEESG